jgi:hypothetical protein
MQPRLATIRKIVHADDAAACTCRKKKEEVGSS